MNGLLPRHVELEGERVVLRPVLRADAPAAFALVRGERRILDWLIWPGPEDVEELARFYAEWARRDERGLLHLHLAVVDRASGAFAGACGLRVDGEAGTATVGYWMGVPYWRGGRASDAVGLLAHLAFAHLGLQLLSACVFVGNDASRRVLERNGWTYDLPRPTRSCGEDREQWHLGLDRPAWEALADRVRPVREDVRLASDAATPADGRRAGAPAPDGG